MGDATDSLMSAALADMSVSVTLGGTDGVGGTTYTQDNNNISNTSLAAGASIEAYVTITYASNGHYVDGNMTVLFGDIMIQYRSVDSPLAIPDPVSELVYPDYIVSSQGEITAYNGSGGAVTISSTLPLYTQSQYEYVKLNECIYMSMTYQSTDETQATSDCTQLKADVESGKTDAGTGASQFTQQFYSGAKSSNLIVPGYYATGSSVTVTSIVADAFLKKNLTSVDIPSSITTIGSHAFDDNDNLSTIRIHNNQSAVTLGQQVFSEGTQIQFDDVTVTYYLAETSACSGAGGSWNAEASTCPGYTCTEDAYGIWACVADE